jgi:hypothetical protein
LNDIKNEVKGPIIVHDKNFDNSFALDSNEDNKEINDLF